MRSKISLETGSTSKTESGDMPHFTFASPIAMKICTNFVKFDTNYTKYREIYIGTGDAKVKCGISPDSVFDVEPVSRLILDLKFFFKFLGQIFGF